MKIVKEHNNFKFYHDSKGFEKAEYTPFKIETGGISAKTINKLMINYKNLYDSLIRESESLSKQYHHEFMKDINSTRARTLLDRMSALVEYKKNVKYILNELGIAFKTLPKLNPGRFSYSKVSAILPYNYHFSIKPYLKMDMWEKKNWDTFKNYLIANWII